jgi:hypothetical protein
MNSRVFTFVSCLVWLAPGLPSIVSAQVDGTRTVVRIEATSPIAEETSAPLRRLNLVGAFTISRTGPTNNPLSVFVQYSGTATPGMDYPILPWLTSIPAGATSTVIRVEAKVDDLPEPVERVVATISNCPPDRDPRVLVPCYDFDVDPAHASATVSIRDDGITEASLEITRPASGEVFKLGQTIVIEAVAIDLHGYISAVEFYDSAVKIGESVIFFVVAPEPGTPIHHTFEWTGAAAGPHVLTARARASDGTGISSVPVRIQVEGVTPEPVVVRIEATQPVAEEDAAPLERLPLIGEFTVSRSRALDSATSVFLLVGGTAVPDKDYEAIPFVVTIPAGELSVAVRVKAVPDDEAEGTETVVARVSNCPPERDPALGIPCYAFEIERERASATILIRDNPFATNHPPAVRITRPEAGAQFPSGTPITIVAEARDPDGYTHRAELFVDGRKIAEQTLEFLVPPPPGEIQAYEFLWRLPEPGTHRLTVRVTDDQGSTGVAPAIGITVGAVDTVPIVTVVARDCFASESGSSAIAVLDTASFLVRRHGPTNTPLTVRYLLEGTAENGVDYEKLEGLVTIPTGSRSALVLVRPIVDRLVERYETVILRLQSPADDPAVSPVAGRYVVGRPASALVIISDEPWPRLAGGAFCQRIDQRCAFVAFDAEPGFHYRVEASADLRAWETLGVQPATEPAVLFTDENAGEHSVRYYRIAPETTPSGD